MLTLVVAGALVLGLAQQQGTDTTVTVRPGGRLDLEGVNGSVTVQTWDREAVRVRATHPTSTRIRVRTGGGGVDVDVDSRGRNSPVTFNVIVPRSYHLNIEGLNFAVTVDGVQGAVSIETVEGAVAVRNVTGDVDIETVSGTVAVDNVTGNVTVDATNQGVVLTAVRGDIEIDATNGSIAIRRAESSSVQAETLNGIVEYDGTIRDGGRYYLGAYNGRITIAVPERTNATMTVSTANGQVSSSFGIPVTGRRDRTFTFTLGSGSARVELESYNGTIRLIRPGGR